MYAGRYRSQARLTADQKVGGSSPSGRAAEIVAVGVSLVETCDGSGTSVRVTPFTTPQRHAGVPLTRPPILPVMGAHDDPCSCVAVGPQPVAIGLSLVSTAQSWLAGFVRL
jgi:hypothetical protein